MLMPILARCLEKTKLKLEKRYDLLVDICEMVQHEHYRDAGDMGAVCAESSNLCCLLEVAGRTAR